MAYQIPAAASNMGRQGTSEGGSLSYFIDVPNGVSQLEPGGTSLRNYANAIAVRDCVRAHNNKGLTADKILVLCYSEAQVRLIRGMITNSSDGKYGCARVCSVDSFEGPQWPLVIVDFVQADRVDKYFLGNTATRPQPNFFVRDYWNLRRATTAGLDGRIVVGQFALLVSGVLEGGQQDNLLFCFAVHLWDEQVISFSQNMANKETYIAYIRHRIASGRHQLGI
ncbi:MAG: hypothetical protein Q9209_001100 [Squamulea sp. 1 TL-2023]